MPPLRRLLLVVAAVALALLVGAPALAHGLILPPPDRPIPMPPPCPDPQVYPPIPCPPPPRPERHVSLQALEVQASVAGGVATVKVAEMFRNDGPVAVEGTYVFPLPPGAQVRSFRMLIDGQPYGGELLDANQARRIYEQTVAQQRDPALLQFVGGGAIQARVFPIPPGAERRLEVEYDRALPRDGDLWELVLPAQAPRVSMTVRLEATGGLRTVYSPTHSVAVVRDGEERATVSYSGGSGSLPELKLYFGGGQGPVDASLLSFREGAEDGYFMLLLDPAVATPADEVVAKDVILVLDTSGSMEGQKMNQARAAGRHVLERLNPGDRFAALAFASTVRSFHPELQPAAEAAAAARWVDGLRAGGGTYISGALAEAQRIAAAGARAGRPQYLLFMTDGLPTVGSIHARDILEQARRDAPAGQRIFAFGVGYDVNTDLLDGLAGQGRGASTYVKPGENLEERISSFYQKVATPVLSDLNLAFSGAQVYDLFPQPLPDLFAGGQLLVLGRYKGAGPVTVRLTGQVNGRPRTFTFDDLGLTRADTARDYVPRLWAGRKIAFLLAAVRQGQESREVVDEIIQLSLRYGILTPYTAFLVQEPQPARQGSGAVAPQPVPPPASTIRDAVQKAPASGASAVEAASSVGGIAAAPSLQAQQAAAPAPAGSGAGTGAPVLRAAGDKTFVLRSGVWTDTRYQAGDPTRDVPFGSAAYYELARRHGRYLAVGMPMVLVVDGQAHRIADTGAPAGPPPDGDDAVPGGTSPAPSDGGTPPPPPDGGIQPPPPGGGGQTKISTGSELAGTGAGAPAAAATGTTAAGAPAPLLALAALLAGGAGITIAVRRRRP